jgi:hypothetical protein
VQASYTASADFHPGADAIGSQSELKGNALVLALRYLQLNTYTMLQPLHHPELQFYPGECCPVSYSTVMYNESIIM